MSTVEIERVRRANAGFYQAFESLSLERMEAVWAHDGQVCCVHPSGPVFEGWDEVRSSWAAIFRGTEAIAFSIGDERIDVRGELAWVLCTERVRSRAGGEGAMTATNLFRREGDEWKLIHHHASPYVPRPPSSDRSLGPRKVLN